ncbi:hypothetical protein TWF281_004491 [Arthrobotrys megalospora]
MPAPTYIFQSTLKSIERINFGFRERLAMYLKQRVERKMSLDAPIDTKVSSVGLDAAGLVAIADIGTVQERTALTGTSSILDIFVLVPGLHLQQKAPGLNAGEYPACGALTSGYVFRVENPATVFYLQRVGETGQLTNVEVKRIEEGTAWYSGLVSRILPGQEKNILATAAYLLAVSWGIAVLVLLILSADWWGVVVCGSLMTARFINFVVIQQRSGLGWAGADEGDERGDLLILLSQDRWVRMKGRVNDLKAVTSGQWLRRESSLEGWFTAIATVIVYLVAALASNVEQFGKILLLCLFVGSAGLLALANTTTKELHMHGCIVRVTGERVKYNRRRDLADALIKETRRDDWALQMGMITPDKNSRDAIRGNAVIT